MLFVRACGVVGAAITDWLNADTLNHVIEYRTDVCTADEIAEVKQALKDVSQVQQQVTAHCPLPTAMSCHVMPMPLRCSEKNYVPCARHALQHSPACV